MVTASYRVCKNKSKKNSTEINLKKLKDVFIVFNIAIIYKIIVKKHSAQDTCGIKLKICVKKYCLFTLVAMLIFTSITISL